MEVHGFSTLFWDKAYENEASKCAAIFSLFQGVKSFIVAIKSGPLERSALTKVDIAHGNIFSYRHEHILVTWQRRSWCRQRSSRNVFCALSFRPLTNHVQISPYICRTATARAHESCGPYARRQPGNLATLPEHVKHCAPYIQSYTGASLPPYSTAIHITEPHIRPCLCCTA